MLVLLVFQCFMEVAITSQSFEGIPYSDKRFNILYYYYYIKTQVHTTIKQNIKTHGSEVCGQETTKRTPN